MFKFRLQAVLDYREFLENMRKMELAEKLKRFMDEQERGDFLRKRRIEYHEAMRVEAAKPELAVTLLSFYQNYLVVVENQIVVQDKRIAAAKKEVERVQELLNEDRKRKEVMVRLKEREFEKYKYEQEAKNQKALDEVANLRFMRMKKEAMAVAAKA